MSSWGPGTAERIEAIAYCREWGDPSMHLSLSLDVLQTTHAVGGAPGPLSLQSFFYYILSSSSTQIFMFVLIFFHFFHGSLSSINSYHAAIYVMLELHGDLALLRVG